MKISTAPQDITFNLNFIGGPRGKSRFAVEEVEVHRARITYFVNGQVRFEAYGQRIGKKGVASALPGRAEWWASDVEWTPQWVLDVIERFQPKSFTIETIEVEA